MPYYTYKCEICDRTTREFRKIDQRHEPLTCNCGRDMLLKLTATQIAPVHGGGSGSGFTRVTNRPPD